ncbi:MAG: fumarylacetoacetate hydrolase family protein, partial [Acidobacteria bacterium]|nr:fumarylacetoacetate hydrolase family protein [Acidobacteriota bacterium]
MRLVTFRRKAAYTEPGLLSGDEIVGLREAGFPDVLSIIGRGADGLDMVREWARRPPSGEVVKVADVRLCAPIPRPPKIICVGLNYRDHAEESRLEIPSVPTIFCKFPTAVIGPGEPIVLPKVSTRPDYEAEFAFVIGRGGRHIPGERWREHVFGYMCFNDVSARDFQLATTQWVIGKTFDTFAPMGPCLVTADEIPDPHNLDISLTLDGDVMQSSNTRHLIFRIPDLIEHLASVFTLELGDVVSSGTPAGVGFARIPPRYLRPGDEV